MKLLFYSFIILFTLSCSTADFENSNNENENENEVDKSQTLSRQIQSFDFWTNNPNDLDASTCWIRQNLAYNANNNSLQIETSTDCKEGSASHQLTYTIKELGESIEISRSYGNFPRDFSYSTNAGISFWVKGNEGNKDDLRLVLFEGINAYQSPNEIYEYFIDEKDENYKILSQATWNKVYVPFSKFTLFYENGGDKKLNLDRIGQVNIQIINHTKADNNNSILIDDLRWQTNLTPPEPSNASFKSVFLPLHVRNGLSAEYDWHNWSAEQWGVEIERMHNMGLNKLIVQYSQVIYNMHNTQPAGGGNLGTYNDGISYFHVTDAKQTPWITQQNGAINAILDACVEFNKQKNTNFKIELGLSHYEPHWNQYTASYDNPQFYQTTMQHIKPCFDQLYTLVNQAKYKDIFAGWYIPQEFNEVYWDTPAKTHLLAEYYRDIADYIKAKDATNKISIAPFFYGYVSTDALANFYDSLFSIINNGQKRIDMVYIQDGIGVSEHRIGIDVPHFVPKIKNVLQKHGQVQIGITIETFDPYDCQGRDRTDLDNISKVMRIRKQLTDAINITNDANQIIAFSWADFQSAYPSIDRNSEQLYQEYMYLKKEER